MYSTYSTPAVFCLVISLLYIGINLVRRYSALSHVPGPKLAAWTDFWLMSKHHKKGNLSQLYAGLQKQYGPIIRYGPKRVMFSDPAAVPIIYATTKVMEKAPSYDVPVVKVNGTLTRSMATIRNEKLVSAIKRQIASAFNANAMHDYEHHIDITVEAFLDMLRVKGPRLDMMPQLSFFSLDTICRLAFSDTMDLMTNQSDVDDILEGARERFRYWHRYFAIPELESLLFKNRFVPSMGAPSALGDIAKKRVQARLEKGGAGIKHDLLDRMLQSREKDPETFSLPLVIGLTITVIHAGSETTAHTLSNVFWDLLRNREVYDRLKAEIRGAGFSSPPQLAEVRRVPYIEACIKESTRMHNLVSNPVERLVPAEGATICGTWIPGGTVVASNAGALAFDTSVYGTDAHVFNPDRWLKGTAQEHAAMERANFAFSQGKRNCLGIHLAWSELLKLLSAILNRFDIELSDPEAVHKVEHSFMSYTEDLHVIATPLQL